MTTSSKIGIPVNWNFANTGAMLGMEIPELNPGAGIKTDLRIWNIDPGKLADNTQSPGNQNSPQNISLYLLGHQNRCDQDSDNCQKNRDSHIIETARPSFKP